MKKGFTLLEICVVAGFASLLLLVAFVQKSNLDAMGRDDTRKTAINAMYYALEEGYYAQHGFYPTTISEKELTMMDPALFTDPDGILMGADGCDYIYIPANCGPEGHCQEYVLRSSMEKEDTYIKHSRTH